MVKVGERSLCSWTRCSRFVRFVAPWDDTLRAHLVSPAVSDAAIVLRLMSTSDQPDEPAPTLGGAAGAARPLRDGVHAAEHTHGAGAAPRDRPDHEEAPPDGRTRAPSTDMPSLRLARVRDAERGDRPCGVTFDLELLSAAERAKAACRAAQLAEAGTIHGDAHAGNVVVVDGKTPAPDRLRVLRAGASGLRSGLVRRVDPVPGDPDALRAKKRSPRVRQSRRPVRRRRCEEEVDLRSAAGNRLAFAALVASTREALTLVDAGRSLCGLVPDLLSVPRSLRTCRLAWFAGSPSVDLRTDLNATRDHRSRSITPLEMGLTTDRSGQSDQHSTLVLPVNRSKRRSSARSRTDRSRPTSSGGESGDKPTFIVIQQQAPNGRSRSGSVIGRIAQDDRRPGRGGQRSRQRPGSASTR